MTSTKWSSEDLRAVEPQRTFSGEGLREVAFPLGGIGTGTVSLGGRGQLRDWELFNRPGKGKDLPYTFFAINATPHGSAGVSRVLERKLLPPYHNGFGLATRTVSGLPRLQEATFHGEYPLAEIEFADDTLPVEVRLEAFNPFIPMDERSSGMPVAHFDWTVTNPRDVPVDVSIAFSVLNAVGYNGADSPGNRHNAQWGQNLNQWRREDDLEGIYMTGAKYAPDSPQFGSMAVATEWPETSYKLRWERAGWWDDAQNFWDEFTRETGRLASDPAESASPDGQTDVGSLVLHVTLEPGQTATLPFTLAWHFPNLTNTWNPEEAVKGKRLGNWYTAEWPDAWAAAREAITDRMRLESATRAYHSAFYSSTLPASVIDAAGANASILRTTTVLRTEDGRMNAFEGCGDNAGCCPMNCTHVWNYVQTVAHLFPSLERSVRLTDFQHNTRPNGDMAFRTLLPLVNTLWGYKPAADGQMGTIMKAYREWRQSGDRAFLETVWPGVERAVEYAWSPGSWDADRDGVMEGEQHNTYDIEFYGPNTMMGTFYLGALRAAEEMALALGRTAKAAEYREVFESGKVKNAELLWNGEFFGQIVNTDLWLTKREPMHPHTHPDTMLADTEPRYQYGAGCLSDHLLGQWFARVVGLGDVLPADKVKAALKAIFTHNWKSDLSNHATVQRVYAVNDEAGLLLCTWPNGGRPKYPFPYADEVWTGIEYQVAAHCLYEGLLDEGLSIVKGARDRHDGAKRNPWDEFECGHHYARAMASWSLVLALSGYQWDAPTGVLTFAPQLNQDNFKCFFSAGTGWGTFSQNAEGGYAAQVHLDWGEVTLHSLNLPLTNGAPLTISVDNQQIEAGASNTGVVFVPPITLRAGQTLSVSA